MNNLSNILMNIKSSNNDELHLIFLEHLLYLHKGIYSKLGNNNIFSEIYLTIQCFLTIQFLWYTSSPAIKSHTLVSSCDLIDRQPKFDLNRIRIDFFDPISAVRSMVATILIWIRIQISILYSIYIENLSKNDYYQPKLSILDQKWQIWPMFYINRPI